MSATKPMRDAKERPILFSSDMVRAILDDRKSQTRRVVKPQPPERWRAHELKDGVARWAHQIPYFDWHTVKCPYGVVGDRLWVRETHYLWGSWVRSFGKNCFEYERKFGAHYADRPPTRGVLKGHLEDIGWYKRPSIFMPRWASRITLEITDVRVERLQEITEADARAEGVVNGGCLNCGQDEPCGCSDPSPDARDGFAFGWNALNSKRGYSWESNPFCWVIGFVRARDAGTQ